MKFVIFSDAHGNRDIVDWILDVNKDADYVVSLGDSGLEHSYLLNRDIVHVKGNIGGDPGFVYDNEIEDAGKRIFLTHGHKYKVHKTLDKLRKKGVSEHYDIVLFGHTHKIHKSKVGKTLFVNPGSCWQSNDGSPPSYAIIDVVGKDVEVTFKRVYTDATIEVAP